MRRCGRSVALALALVLASATWLAGGPASAQANPTGAVLVIPGSGSDLTPIRVRTSAGCPANASAFYARMMGRGFPPDGQVVTANTAAGMSHSFGFDVYFLLVMRDYAHNNHTTLGGRYDITVFCVNRLTLQSYGEFTGSLEFTSPTHYEALGAAKPTGPPPLELALAGDGSALAPAAAAPPAGTPSVAEPPGRAAQGRPAPTVQPPPGSDPPPPSAVGQFASQGYDETGQSVPWLVLVGGVLWCVGVVLMAGVVITAANRIRKWRSP